MYYITLHYIKEAARAALRALRRTGATAGTPGRSSSSRRREERTRRWAGGAGAAAAARVGGSRAVEGTRRPTAGQAMAGHEVRAAEQRNEASGCEKRNEEGEEEQKQAPSALHCGFRRAVGQHKHDHAQSPRTTTADLPGEPGSRALQPRLPGRDTAKRIGSRRRAESSLVQLSDPPALSTGFL